MCFDMGSCVLSLTDDSLPSPTSHEDVNCRHEELVFVSLVSIVTGWSKGPTCVGKCGVNGRVMLVHSFSS